MVERRSSDAGSRIRRNIWSISALALILVASGALCRAQTTATLTNDDVVKMVRAQLATDIILTTIETSNAKFDVTPAGLIALKEAGVPDQIVQAMQAKMRASPRAATPDASTGNAPEKSELLATAKEPAFILRNFKTMFVDASGASYFGNAQMKAALWKNKDFRSLNISIVDDRAVADVVLDVDYTFAWDYPFTLRHQNTSVVLLSGKGSGPFSGPKGASSVANELVKALKPYRPAARGR